MNGWEIAFNITVLIGWLAFIGWVACRSLKKSDDPGWLAARWVLTGLLFPTAVGSVVYAGVIGMPILLVCSIIMSILWAPSLGTLLSKPFSSMYDGGSEEPDRRPLYSITQARRKQGRYTEAIAEARKQLHLFPNDFEGLMLLAEIYAGDQKDLTSAEHTLRPMIDDPATPLKDAAWACHRLADWAISVNQDPEAASDFLRLIIDRDPESAPARRAQMRLSHMANREAILDQIDPKPIEMRPAGSGASAIQPDQSPDEVAGELVHQLELFPEDHEARERLAVIYADHYQRLDLANEQLEQLIAIPDQSPRQAAHWLHLMADLEIRDGQNIEAARTALTRILQLYPGTASAESAQTRLACLNLELNRNKERQAIKLGVYEQNIGLKTGPPKRG